MKGSAFVLGLCCAVGLFAALNVVLAQEPAGKKPADAQLIGDYVGTFQSLGKGDAKVAAGAKPKVCGSCHAEASVTRAENEYVLALRVEHGKTKEGKPNMQKFTFKGQPEKDGLLFKDANYSITVADGKITGGRTGKVIAKVALERKSAAETKP